MLLAFLGGDGSASGSGPSAAPSGVTLNYYSGSYINVQWVNGDATADVEIGTSTGSTAGSEPDTTVTTVGAGNTSYPTGTTGFIRTSGVGTFWWVRHTKGGEVSAWVSSSTSRVTAV